MNYKIELGNRLKEARTRKNLTQQQVCEKLSIPKVQTLSAYETGKNTPPLDKLTELSKLYGVSTDYLLLGDVRPSAPIEKKSCDYVHDLIMSIVKLDLRLNLCCNNSPVDPSDFVAIEIDESEDFYDTLLQIKRLHDVKDIIGWSDYMVLVKKKIADYIDGYDLPF